MPFLFLLGQAEQELEQTGEVLFDVGDNHPLEAGLRPDALDPAIEAAQNDHRLCARVMEKVLHLALHIERIAADNNGADAPGRISGNDELRATREHDRHPITLFHTHGLEGGSKTVRRIVDLAVRELCVHQAGTHPGSEDGGGVIRVLERRVAQELVYRDRRVVDSCRHAFIVVFQPGLYHGDPPFPTSQCIVMGPFCMFHAAERGMTGGLNHDQKPATSIHKPVEAGRFPGRRVI